MNSAFHAALVLFDVGKVASTGIEPVSGASETLILSIVRRGQLSRESIVMSSESGSRLRTHDS